MSETSSRRTRALLAGGAVLGLGTVATLALWSDSEFASSIFSAIPSFIVESAATAEGPFESHDAAVDAVPLNFPIPTEGMAVGEPVATELWLRMDTEASGSVSILAPAVELDDLSSRIDVTLAQGACADPGAVLQAGTLATLGDVHDAFILPPGVGGGAGEAQPVCITATLTDTDGLLAGEYSTGRVVWEFAVTEVTA